MSNVELQRLHQEAYNLALRLLKEENEVIKEITEIKELRQNNIMYLGYVPIVYVGRQNEDFV